VVAIAQAPAPDAVELAMLVPDKVRSKYDWYLGDDLLARCYANEQLETCRVPEIARMLLDRMPEGWRDEIW